MTANNITSQRLIRQQLTSTKFKKSVELITWFGALQAQEYSLTKWAIGLRLPHLTDADLEQDFNSGKILRTHVLRPTWHFVAAQDIRWMLELTKSRVHTVNAFMYRKLELDKKLFTKCTKIIIRSLDGGNELTRDAINEEFKRNKIKAEGHRLSYIMMHAELEGIICSGGRKGNQFTYALIDERVASGKTITREEALMTLVKRYFMSRGPATIHDFATWSGLTLTDCRKGIEMMSKELQKEVMDDKHYFSFSQKKNTTSPTIHLLPVYDEYIMGYKNRDAMLQVYNRIKPRPPFGFDNTIVCNGQIIGTWRRVVKPTKINLEYSVFKPLSIVEKKEFNKAITRYKKFTGLNVIVQS